jgi:hypothetical protein
MLAAFVPSHPRALTRPRGGMSGDMPPALTGKEKTMHNQLATRFGRNAHQISGREALDNDALYRPVHFRPRSA